MNSLRSIEAEIDALQQTYAEEYALFLKEEAKTPKYRVAAVRRRWRLRHAELKTAEAFWRLQMKAIMPDVMAQMQGAHAMTQLDEVPIQYKEEKKSNEE